MKNATLLHGTSCTPEMFWFPYLTGRLEQRGFDVRSPLLPDADRPDISKWLPVVRSLTYDETSVLVGHSAGCPLILALLETLGAPVAQTVLVAGFCTPIGDQTWPILQDTYDWERIRDNAGELFIICSDDDPWGCDDTQGAKMFDRLGGNLLIRKGEGHMGSVSYDQPYLEFPLLDRIIA